MATSLTGLLSFLVGSDPTTGSIDSSDAQKRLFARQSAAWNARDARFRELFPELAAEADAAGPPTATSAPASPTRGALAAEGGPPPPPG